MGYKLKFKRSIDSISLKRIGKTFVIALPALIVPGVIIGGVVAGLFTATEAGAVSCICALVASAIYREMDWKKLPEVFLRSCTTGGGILLMISCGGVIAWSMTRSGIPQKLITLVNSITNNRNIIIIFMIIILMIGGCPAG